MRILITGGAGFIGSNLTKYHLDKNHDVVVLDNLITGSEINITPYLDHKNFKFIKDDITTVDYSRYSPFDIIYHLASPASPIQYKKYPIETLMTNALGTQRLLEFMHNSSSKVFILASTSEVYGDPLVHPQTEEYFGNVNTVGPRSCYDEGKRFAEAVASTYRTKYKMDIRIARLFNTYGPNMEQNDGRVVSNFIMQALTGKPITIYGDGTQTRSFCYVSDMVEAFYRLATTEALSGIIVNLGNPDERTVKELAQIVKEMTQSPSEIVNHPIDADDPKKRKPDITKAKERLHWEPIVPLAEGLKKTIKYFKTRFI